ncbi:MAG: linear amide C-N hydrolase [Lachnospiraceae bacterium]|nr:linear amide C-N hydrolase [Lachnospiraceae bacterium]
MGRKILKIIRNIFLVLLLAVIILLAGAWSIFGEMVTAAQSVKKIEEGLYYIEFSGDYGFDEFLEKGGASSEAAMAEHIMSFLSGGFMKTGTDAVPQDFGCSTLTVGNAEDGSLMGRNFDWEGENGTAIVIHTKPEGGYESYSTCWLDFLGFGENWKPEGMANQYMAIASIYVPLDGMNEKGLCIADLVNGDSEQTHQRTDKVDLTTNSAIRLLLDRAATVDEAIELLQQYDMNSAIGMSHHLSIADASGRSVVVEYVNNEMIVTETLAVTNHYLSEGEKYGVGNEESHARFDKLMNMRSDIASVDQLRDGMESVSYAGITQWSIVYDTKNMVLDFFWQRDYENPHQFKFVNAE